jgi:hypothetical protein
MNWARLFAIVVGDGVVSSLTDWFFAGDWIHRRYTYPEIWRQGAEGRAIALTSPLPFLTSGVFAYSVVRMVQTGPRHHAKSHGTLPNKSNAQTRNCSVQGNDARSNVGVNKLIQLGDLGDLLHDFFAFP